MTEPFTVKLSPAGREYYFKNGDEDRQAELARVHVSFREFLNYWNFVDQDTGRVRVLGHELWPAQEEFVRVAQDHPWTFYLKARQLGESTIACAYDGWVVRFREGGANSRVHIFSKRENEAKSLLERVKFGLARLPEHMQLPIVKDSASAVEFFAGPDDRRIIVAYPADNDTARGETCTHAHVDEWAFMGNPSRVWQSIEPSAAGTVHFITTGQGPENWTSVFWRKCLAGDVLDRRGDKVYPCFIGALERPDRSAAWLKAKRAGMDERTFLQEYPMRWEDALSGGGDYVFKPREIDAAGRDFRGLMSFAEGEKLKKQPRRYLICADIGRHQDAAVIIVLDVTEDVIDVVFYQRLRELPYPAIQREIKVIAEHYPGPVVIEGNAAGEAVLENLDLPEYRLVKFTTTKPSKARIIQGLRVALQNQLIKWDPNACQQLDVEMRGYQEPDDNVVQDSVMTLAIGLDNADLVHKAGRMLPIHTA